jgi:outer membrane protein
VSKKVLLMSFVWCMVVVLCYHTDSAKAADQVKIGVMNIQKVLVKCSAGVKVRAKLDKKVKEVEAQFKKEQDKLMELQAEIEKKSSIWSKDTKEEKMLEFNKMRRDFKTKTDDARVEMKKLQEKELEPILKALEKVVHDYGKANKYTIILESKTGIVYFDKAQDISDALIKEMDKSMK